MVREAIRSKDCKMKRKKSIFEYSFSFMVSLGFPDRIG